MTLSETDVLKSVCKESYFQFVKRFWSTIEREEPVWNWHIEFLCNELQKLGEAIFNKEPKPYDLIINVSPGTSKSTVTSKMFPAWCWVRFPAARFICASYTSDLAQSLGRTNRDLVDSEKYRETFGVELKRDARGINNFENTQGGFRKAVGAGGNIVGRHAHCVIVDDPISPDGSSSEADLKTVNTWLTQTLPSRMISLKRAPMILIMQRLHENDPTAYMLNQFGKDNIRHIKIPAESNAGYEVKPLKLKRYYKDGVMDPVRLPRSILDSMKMRIGQYSYAGQFGQEPSPPEGGMFKVVRIKIDEPPLQKFFKKIVRFWDKAGTHDGGAFTAGVKIGEDRDGFFWVLDVVRGQWDSFEREQKILQTAQMDGKGIIVGVEQEPGSGGKESAENTIRRLAGFTAQAIRPSGDKVQRADPYSTQVNGGNVRMIKAEWNQQYLEELRLFPESNYRDQVDASSGAFSILFKPTVRVGAL